MSDKIIISTTEKSVRALMVEEVPKDICAGDVFIRYSANGEMRDLTNYNFLQKTWINIDSRIRKWLKI